MVDVTKTEEKKIDTSNLEANLAALKGHDFELAEFAERNKGNTSPLITFSSAFQARLAAMALKCTPDDLKDLSIKEYTSVINRTANFLFGSSESEKIPSAS